MYKAVKKVTVRLSLEDYASLVSQSNELNKSMNEYVREMIRKNMFHNIREFNLYLAEIYKQTKIISNNINQLAKFKNSKVLFDEIEESKKLNKELDNLCQLLKW